MRTVVMTVMALMVATVAVAEDTVIIQDELVFTCDKSGNDNSGFDVRVLNKGTSPWNCNVEVETVPTIDHSKRWYPNTYVGVSGSHQFVGGYSGTHANLQCSFKKVTCTRK